MFESEIGAAQVPLEHLTIVAFGGEYPEDHGKFAFRPVFDLLRLRLRDNTLGKSWLVLVKISRSYKCFCQKKSSSAMRISQDGVDNCMLAMHLSRRVNFTPIFSIGLAR